MIGSELLRFQDNQKYILFDYETEGLNLFASRPWQLSYAICNSRYIEKVITRYPLFKDINVSDDAARITRFDKKKYLQIGEDPAIVLRDFEELAMDPNYLLLGHNLMGFDNYVWQTLCRLQGKSIDWSFVARVVDTLCLSRAYRHQIAPDLKDFTAWQYKMLTLRTKGKGFGASLGAMAREFQIPYDERLAHDATYDCNINHKVFQKLIWSVEV